MKILHICGNYIGNNLYQHLFENLNLLDVKQFIYVPVRSKHHIGLNNVEFCDVQYDFILKPYHRILYFSKINKIYKSLLSDFNYDLIHAHTLFSDGGLLINCIRNLVLIILLISEIRILISFTNFFYI